MLNWISLLRDFQILAPVSSLMEDCGSVEAMMLENF